MTDQTEAPAPEQTEVELDPVEVGWDRLRRYIPPEIDSSMEECPAELTELATEVGTDVIACYTPPEEKDEEPPPIEEPPPEGGDGTETPVADYSVRVLELMPKPEPKDEPAAEPAAA